MLVLTLSQTNGSFLTDIFIRVVQTSKEGFANLRGVSVAEHSQAENRPITDLSVWISRKLQKSKNRLCFIWKRTERERRREADILIGMILIAQDHWNGSGVIQMAETGYGGIKD